MINLDNVPQEWVEQFEQKISWEEAISTGLELREKKDNSQWELDTDYSRRYNHIINN